MSLISRWRGEVKSGKTASMLWWAMQLAARCGFSGHNIFTNMTGCWDHDPNSPTYGQAWATTITLNDLLADMLRPDDEAEISHGLLIWDEAHIYMGTNNMRGAQGDLLTAALAQCGKRGLAVVYTTHLAGMVTPRVRGLTMLDIKCHSWNQGNGCDWRVTDQVQERDDKDEGLNRKAPWEYTLYPVSKIWHLYETNEVIDAFAAARSAGASKAGKAMLKQLGHYIENGGELNVPEIGGVAAHNARTLQAAKDQQEMMKADTASAPARKKRLDKDALFKAAGVD